MNEQTQEALKMAIKALEMWDKKHIIEMKVGERWIDLSYAINACKEALEQPTVAELNDEYLRDTNVIGLEQPAQEPVSLGDFDNMSKAECVDYIEYLRKEIDLLRFKEWQGLTDNEKLLSIRKWSENNTMRGIELIGLCDAIEQALKEKNT